MTSKNNKYFFYFDFRLRLEIKQHSMFSELKRFNALLFNVDFYKLLSLYLTRESFVNLRKNCRFIVFHHFNKARLT